MRSPPKIHLRCDYRPYPYLIDQVELIFDLDPQATQVEARMTFARNAEAADDAPLALDGEALAASCFAVDGEPWQVEVPPDGSGRIELTGLPARGTLSVQTRISPATNDALSGLYLTGGTFCTQCEAEGFRRITWFPDRPDVLARYRVTLRADAERYPVVLANGNRVAEAVLPDGRVECIWEDPFPKPSYLFALVAGRLECLRDVFITASGRSVSLELYTGSGRLDRFRWAMSCLKEAMRWDEQTYGREYDLDRYMIFAAADFNAGAMENKGLNVFNSRYLLADPEIATDEDFHLVDVVLAHEYFHNWSGNRVTCRDWFQLSLKEGFTVFREQQYAATRGSPAVQRIEQAAFIIARQFPQAAGPLAHPVRPEQYEDIDNFYTVTVYEKGAEVLRMLHRLVGDAAWRRGCDLYFSRHDGQAVTCDDFLAAIAKASGRDLSQFARWYAQAGTPRLAVRESFDPDSRQYRLELRQSVPATAAATPTLPMTIPLAYALFTTDGERISEGQAIIETGDEVLTFDGIAERPIPSLLRGFSSPVEVDLPLDAAALATLVRSEVDGFARWRALRSLQEQAFAECLACATDAGECTEVPSAHALATLVGVVRSLCADRSTDPALLAHLLTMPSCAEMADTRASFDPQCVLQAHRTLEHTILAGAYEAMAERYREERAAVAGRPWRMDAADAAHRSLAAALLMRLNAGEAGEALEWAMDLYAAADNLTDRMAALNALVQRPVRERAEMLERFHRRSAHEPLLLNRWYALWAKAPDSDAIRMAELEARADFDPRNPNRVRALLGTFGQHNWAGFHRPDASGYHYLAERIVAYDRRNPSLAAGLSEAFSHWPRALGAARQSQRQALEQIAAAPGLSLQLAECVGKMLAAEG